MSEQDYCGSSRFWSQNECGLRESKVHDEECVDLKQPCEANCLLP